MKNFTTCFISFFIFNLSSMYAQTLENTCWIGYEGIDSISRIEHLSGDSLYLTRYYKGKVWYPRKHVGWYYESNDTLTVSNLPSSYCGTDSAIYNFTISNNILTLYLIQDPCAYRANNYEPHHYSCESVGRLTSSCISSYNSGTGDTYQMELLPNDTVYLSSYDAQGNPSFPRTHIGWYYHNDDSTVVFENFSWTTCGADSGVYRFIQSNNQVYFRLISDPCTARVTNMVDGNHIKCNTTDMSLQSTCWYGINQNFEKTMTLELIQGNRVYLSIDSAGSNIYPRKHIGWFDHMHDSITFNEFPWTSCGTVSGVYTIEYTNHQILFTSVNDPCSSREDNMTTNYKWYDCSFIGETEFSVHPIQIVVYPNPANETLTIEQIGQDFKRNSEVLIFDLLGNRLIDKKLLENGKSISMDVNLLNEGLHILQVVQEGEVLITKKIIIQH